MANTIFTFLIDDIEHPSVSFMLYTATSSTAPSESVVSIDWGDGSIAETETISWSTPSSDKSHTFSHSYASTGTYNVEVTCVSGTIGIPYAGGEGPSIYGNFIALTTGDGLVNIDSSSLGWQGFEDSHVDNITIGPNVTNLCSPFCTSYIDEVVIDGGQDLVIDDSESLISNTYIKSVTIGGYITAIPNECFWWVEGLTDVTFGDNVTSVGHDIFSSCDDLTDLYFCGETPPTFESDSIDSELSLTIHVPTGTVSDYTTALTTISPAPTLTIEEWDPPAPTPVYPESFVNNARLREVINETKARLSTKQDVFQYSYAEVDTGKKWINGKPIYCKTFSEGEGTYQNVLPNIHRVIAVEAVGEALNAATTPPAHLYMPPSPLSSDLVSWIYQITDSQLLIASNVPSGSTTSFVNFIITVYYTKTTD